MKKLRGRNLAHPGCLIGITTGLMAGTHNGWYASAFTQGSLPWNLETLLGCQCANELVQVYYRLLPMSSK